MSTPAIKTSIATVTARILEDWGMMMVDPLPVSPEVFQGSDKIMMATISFKGVVDGSYKVMCQQAFAEQLARNLLGSDESATESEQHDALREMANVLCGNLLTECYGNDTIFDLSAPSVSTEDVASVAPQISSRTVCYSADGQPVVVNFSLSGEPEGGPRDG